MIFINKNFNKYIFFKNEIPSYLFFFFIILINIYSIKSKKCNIDKCQILCEEIYSFNVLSLEYLIGLCGIDNYCFCFKKLESINFNSLYYNYTTEHFCTRICQDENINKHYSRYIEENKRIYGDKINESCNCYYRFN